MTVLSLLIFAGILILVVFVHEMGHFIAAKVRGVKVEEFGIGFPPRLFAFKRGETEYSINAVPLGGFVRMPGELDPDEDERGLSRQGYGTRLLVMSAGSIMNLLLPIILLIIAFSLPMQVGTGVKIYENPQPGTPAEQAGIKQGDIFVSGNGQPIQTSSDLSQIIQSSATASPAESILFVVDRAGEEIVLTVNPPYLDGDKIGVTTTWADTVSMTYPLWQAFSIGFQEYGRIWAGLGTFFVDLFRGQASLDVTGPVGIADATIEIVQFGASAVLVWTALISISIGLMNLIIPIPVFDGGHILFLFIEWIRRGKRISLKKRATIQAVSWLMILALFVLITYRDIARIISGESLFP